MTVCRLPLQPAFGHRPSDRSQETRGSAFRVKENDAVHCRLAPEGTRPFLIFREVDEMWAEPRSARGVDSLVPALIQSTGERNLVTRDNVIDLLSSKTE